MPKHKKWKTLDEIVETLSFVPVKYGDFATDIYEDKDTVYIEMDLSGIDVDNINISAENHHVIITGTREETIETEDKLFHKKEIRRGGFEKIIDLPADVTEDKATAEYKDGILFIVFPKKHKKEPRKIKVTKKK